jgi:hypothetical protein
MKFFNKKNLLIVLLVTFTLGFTGCSSGGNSTTTYTDTSFTADNVARLYISTYNKPLSYTTMDGFMELSSIDAVIDQLNPNRTIYPESDSYTEFVKALYINVFSREGSDGEVQIWVAKLQNRDVLRKDMWWEFVISAIGIDKITVDNKLEVSKYYADTHKYGDYSLINVTDDPATVEVAKSEIDRLAYEPEPIPDPTQSLTNGEDHISIDYGYDMSGDDIIEGKILNGTDTLQTYDGIDGGTGYNIVRATVINGSAATY